MTNSARPEGDLIPLFKSILLEDVRVYGEGKVSLDGTDSAHPLQMRLDGVELSGVSPRNVHATHAQIVTGPREVNFVPLGEDVQVSREHGSRNVQSCDGRFAPLADLAASH